MVLAPTVSTTGVVYEMMPRQGTMIADRYRLERKVGGGRVSAMWRVRDQVTDGTCAIKLLHRSMNDHPEALARFSLEDRLSRELTGEYFPERVGSGSWHSLRYIAWRWYEGECLRSLFERNPKQDVHTVYSIVQETCQALAVVHSAGYTHGDLKPENLFFAERSEKEKEASRQLKLIGFGVASRLARPLLGAQARRTPGQIVGTPLYMSPDLILGRVPRGGQADLWALSVIVYEALTGRSPFLGSDLGEVLQKILDRQAPRPSAITNNLPGTFDLWWQQALEQQFATPAELSAGLARALAPALRSSRTQRSASLPDRTAPVMEIVVPRATYSGGGLQRGESTPIVPAVAVRSSALTPAGGVAAAGGGASGRAPLPGLAAASPVASTTASSSATASSNPVASSLAPSSPVATSPTGGRSANRSAGSSSATNGTSAQLVSFSNAGVAADTSSSAAAGSAAAAQLSAPVGSITALGVGRPQDATPLMATLVAKADARPSAAPDAPGVKAQAARSASAAAVPDASLGAEAAFAKAGTGTLVASKAEAASAPAGRPVAGKATSDSSSPRNASAGGVSPNSVAPGGATPSSAASKAAAAKTAPSLTRGDARGVDPGRQAPAQLQSGSSAAAAAAATAPAEPLRSAGGNVTSTTVAGIGPAALTMMRALEAAAAGATAKIRVAAPRADGAIEQDSDKFTAVPSPLSGLGTRKTLVGIVPPAAAKPAASTAPSTPAAPVAGSRKTESMVIAGTPCKSIDDSSEEDGELPPSIAALRRPGSPTVPFPRPRAASRAMPWELDAAADDPTGRDTIPQSWRERTGHTLRIVLTDPDHRPHLIAGIVVCAAAALVIFAAGRSPVAGTGELGQATRSLEPPAPASPAAPASPTAPATPSPGTTEPLQRAATLDSAASAAPGGNAAAPAPEAAQLPRLRGEELAPGLVIPPRTPAETEARPRTESRPKPSPSLPPSAAPASPALRPASGPVGEARPAPPGQPATSGAELHPSVAPRAAPKKPGGTEPGAPARPANGDFDFGI
jgi:serine/threonine-protein kinase